MDEFLFSYQNQKFDILYNQIQNKNFV